jgi:osmoprotectant transport system permease protein
MNFLLEAARWFADPAHWQGAGGVPNRVGQHVALSLEVTSAAAVIAIPLGLVLGHYGRGGALAINIANVGRAVPSFALLVLAVQVVGIGVLPAFVALLALAIPPMVTNSYVAMRGVDERLREAARGLGMRSAQVLWKVELPNAIPVVMAGVRTSGVQVVATAPLAALVGWGGLGRFIVDGLSQENYVEVFCGAVLTAALAAVAELVLGGLQLALTPRGLRRRRERPQVLAVGLRG